MKLWGAPKHDQLIGMDISSSAVRVLAIDTNVSPYEVKVYRSVALSPGVIVKAEIKNPSALSESLDTLFSSIDFPSKNIALAIPRASVLIKTLIIDARLTPSEIETRAWIEANNHFPDLIGDIYLDFHVIGPSEDNPSRLEIMLVACRKDQVKPYLDILSGIGLVPKVIDVNSFAFERALMISPNDENITTALLNLDTALSSLVVLQNKKLIYAHDHTYDGQRLLTQAGEYIKNNPGNTTSLSDANYIEILKAALTSHLRHTIHFFYSSKPNVSIQKLWVAGECAAIPFIDEFIQQELGVKTALPNPFDTMQYSTQVDSVQLKQDAPKLMLCCGLALSREIL